MTECPVCGEEADQQIVEKESFQAWPRGKVKICNYGKKVYLHYD